MIVTEPLERTLYGFSGSFQPGKAWDAAKPLMDRLWTTLKAHGIPNQGINHWVYGPKGRLFVGEERSARGSDKPGNLRPRAT